MNLTTIFLVLFIHWLADFVLQSDEQAKGKSTSMKWLLSHTFSYASIWFMAGLSYIFIRSNGFVDMSWYKEWSLMYFVCITFIAHTITDYFTSRLNTYLWNKGDAHNFFVSVGFDQLLHYAQLFLTLHYLTN